MQNMENPQMKLDTELDTEMHYLDTELPFGKVGLLSLKKSTRLPEIQQCLRSQTNLSVNKKCK